MATDDQSGDIPPPDTKDWTWVLERPCPQCSFDASSIEPGDVAAAMRANAAGFRAALKRGDIVGQRPPVAPGSPPVWSALEYGAHVRDVYALAAERLSKMIKKKSPTFTDWDQDGAAVDGRYRQADPDKVAYGLALQAGKVADMLDRVRGGDWERTGSRSDGATFTIASFAAYILHDVTHHLWDVDQGFEAITAAAKKAAGSAGAGEN